MGGRGLRPARVQPERGLPGQPGGPLADAREQTEAHVHVVSTAWSCDYPSIEDYLRPLYATGARGNDGRYANPRFDAALANGDAASTQEAAVTAYQAAEDIVAGDMPVVPTWFGQNAVGYSTRVSHVDVDARANVDLVTLAAH